MVKTLPYGVVSSCFTCPPDPPITQLRVMPPPCVCTTPAPEPAAEKSPASNYDPTEDAPPEIREQLRKELRETEAKKREKGG